MFCAELYGAIEDFASLALGPVEMASFPLRPTGHDDRLPPAGQRAGDIRIAHQIEPELNQISVNNRIAPLTQLCRRGRGDGDDKKWSGHKKSLFNRSG